MAEQTTKKGIPRAPLPKGKRWRWLRAAVKREAEGLCVKCRAAGRLTPGVEVDHIEPRWKRPDLLYMKSNLQLLCKQCHFEKSQYDRGQWHKGWPKVDWATGKVIE